MPHAMPRRSPASQRHHVKPDPGVVPSPVVSDSTGATSLRGASSFSSRIPVDESFYRNNRSDAPPPSELLTEPEPLLKEVRARLTTAHESPATMDESFFHTSFQDIGKKLKECNDTLGELQQLGVSHDVQLPELVLVGDQSAGKSSLMSGLANLDLPRSDGACTRCPLHIRVSRNTEWSCRVSLRKDYAYRPPSDRQIDEDDVTVQDPFFPWKKKSNTTVHEFKTMHDKSEIEDVLRWAQIAVLNDDKPHDLFVPGSGSIAQSISTDQATESTLAKFSPNIVSLEIRGPELPDLSFYDMPGIFQNPADARDDYLVVVVRNLAMAYIQHPSAIILCSMPMNVDAENSCTFGLIRRLNASSRTIGVLTKADLVPESGNHDQWLAIMKGEAHQTGLGYFITARPQDKSLENVLRWEESFFENHVEEWWPAKFHEFSDRCGVEKLKAFLSERLGEEFAKSLPFIKQKVKTFLDKTQRQLTALPELPDNVELEIQTSLINFADAARENLTRLCKHFNELPRAYRDCLLAMKPKFTLKDHTDCPIHEISDDESDAGSVATSQATPSAKRYRNGTVQQTPSKRQRTEQPLNGGGSFSSNARAEDQRGSLPPPSSPARRQGLLEPFAQFASIGRGFRTIRQVHEDMQTKMQAGMPIVITTEVYQDLAIEAVIPWKDPTDVLLRRTMERLQAELDSTLGKAFETLKKRFVYQEAKKYLRNYLEIHRKTTAEELQQLYLTERESVLTFNDEALAQYQCDEELLLMRFRHHVRMAAQPRKDSAAPPAKLIPWESLTEEKRVQDMKRRETEVKGLGPDPFKRAIEVVAYVRGYYRLSALRFSDNVSQRIICRMIPQVRRNLSAYLEQELGLRGPNSQQVYEKLVEEDEATMSKRRTLRMELTKFETALASIETLETGITRAQTGPDVVVEDSMASEEG